MLYARKPANVAIATIRKVVVLAFFFSCLSSTCFSCFCLAQEVVENQPSGQESNNACRTLPGLSSESCVTLPSLTSLLTQSVIFIYEDKTTQNLNSLVPGRVLGTAFLIGIPQPGRSDRSIPFVVTARHVIADETKILGRYTPKSGTNPVFAQYNLEDLRKNGDLWEYDNDEGVDIVVFRSSIYDNVKFQPFPMDLVASKDIFTQAHIDVADRIMIPCLLESFPGIAQNYPIFRDGSIARITEEPISYHWTLGRRQIETQQRIIFINSVLNEGFSGAPVFLWRGIRSTPEGNTAIGEKPWLIGIVHGYFPQLRQVLDADGEEVTLSKPSKEPTDIFGQTKPPRKVAVVSKENSATGVLLPSWRLLEIIQSESVKKRVQQLTDEESKGRPQDKKTE